MKLQNLQNMHWYLHQSEVVYAFFSVPLMASRVRKCGFFPHVGGYISHLDKRDGSLTLHDLSWSQDRVGNKVRPEVYRGWGKIKRLGFG